MLKQSIHKLLDFLGLQVKRNNLTNSEKILLKHLLDYHNIDLVIDVGANTGQYAKQIINEGFKGDVISFEPLPDAFAQLKSRSNKYSNWKAVNTAIGNFDGTIKINVSKNSESSSVLPMLKNLADAAPESVYIAEKEVTITRLDNFFEELATEYKSILLKIDVQGFEMQVLEGSASVLSKAKIIQTELSFVPLYDNSVPYIDMITKLEQANFYLYSLSPAFINYKTGQLFQVDGIFVRHDS